jgi:tellurite resistance protein
MAILIGDRQVKFLSNMLIKQRSRITILRYLFPFLDFINAKIHGKVARLHKVRSRHDPDEESLTAHEVIQSVNLDTNFAEGVLIRIV